MQRAPHVLLFICDQLQYQRLGFAGRLNPSAPSGRTPQLDQLAEEGIFYTHVHSSNGQCVPSRASMQTGLYPHEAGVMIIYGFHGHSAHLTADQRTVGNVLRDAGYTTAYFGKAHFGIPLADLGYDHGHDGRQGERAPRRNSATDRAIVDDALAFLRAHDPERPLFLTVSIHQPHPPFELVERFAGRFPPETLLLPPSFRSDDLSTKPAFHQQHATDGRHGYPTAGLEDEARLRVELQRYLTMTANVDALFGEVRRGFEEKGMWGGTAALFTSDHGDMMGAHRMRLKGTIPYDEIFRIPFILKLPDGSPEPERRVVSDLGCNVAQPGTLVEAAGLPIPSDFTGGSLLPAAYRAAPPEREEVFFEHYGAYWGLHPFRAVRVRDPERGEWKLAKYYGPDEGEAELYDLGADPHENTNRARDPELAVWRGELERRVDDWWERTGGRGFAYYESREFKASGEATLTDRRGGD
ncbi:MAG TPA: sulfatase-like hydrolase/transferase [Chloroflexota bacterium]|nr:sulfatase-like hydrolase/transferase [Chloroflexota bacterium]